MGQKKIPIEFMQNKRRRRAAFKYKKDTIFKKAAELSVLCGVRFLTIMVDERGEIFSCSNEDPQKLMDEYAHNKDSAVHKDVEEFDFFDNNAKKEESSMSYAGEKQRGMEEENEFEEEEEFDKAEKKRIVEQKEKTQSPSSKANNSNSTTTNWKISEEEDSFPLSSGFKPVPGGRDNKLHAYDPLPPVQSVLQSTNANLGQPFMMQPVVNPIPNTFSPISGSPNSSSAQNYFMNAPLRYQMFHPSFNHSVFLPTLNETYGAQDQAGRGGGGGGGGGE